MKTTSREVEQLLEELARQDEQQEALRALRCRGDWAEYGARYWPQEREDPIGAFRGLLAGIPLSALVVLAGWGLVKFGWLLFDAGWHWFAR